ncbi:PREDICTED: yrdC domain-containing protein, mitochondrial isoform X2 [Vollenhovia emeryi]|uniref:yrdC domain-containing protein, mitochondrial isoform X2 n=1 Tax=Vollenhovia emeryi TaxID=411798 RepID=UPI0005F3BAE9|nr:PREDICTED: yrdC domain-containing protein, mitochondrial isoform X2 [Vollenhovia emeryi]
MKVRSCWSVRYIMSPGSMGPMKIFMNRARREMKMLGSDEKHLFCGGDRSVAMAAEMLRQGKVIAIPTDTVYGLACLATNSQAVQRLYKIKRRSEQKPLAICLSNVKEIGAWGVMDDIPVNMLEALLPGPYTICLRRTPALNRDLNPGLDTVGIRVPNDKFVLSVAQIVGPLALTSANVSSEPSSLHPDEFRALWPELGGVFHNSRNCKKQTEARRIGSTVVDVSSPGCFTVVRRGINADLIVKTLEKFGLSMTTAE